MSGSNKRSYILKQLVCLSMCELLSPPGIKELSQKSLAK